ncbi:ribulose-phosphate 3-epimerase [Patescibacteria group bacterium]|nr:ribulose-phosphate 3-epimerase [Patescibacteria group bacterium]
MIEVIPTILVKDFKELKEKIKLVESHVKWVQLDVMDGIFVDNTTWNNPVDLKNLEIGLKLEAHLMIEEPENYIDEWIKSGVKRIIFHYEATDKHREIIEKIKKAGLEVGLALNPETSIDVVDNFIKDLDLILIMTVNPGWGGQEFLEKQLGKIKQLRNKYQDVKIEIDGGISLETAPKVIKAGANLLAVGSVIFESDNIKETIWKLKN